MTAVSTSKLINRIGMTVLGATAAAVLPVAFTVMILQAL